MSVTVVVAESIRCVHSAVLRHAVVIRAGARTVRPETPAVVLVPGTRRLGTVDDHTEYQRDDDHRGYYANDRHAVRRTAKLMSSVRVGHGRAVSSHCNKQTN